MSIWIKVNPNKQDFVITFFQAPPQTAPLLSFVHGCLKTPQNLLNKDQIYWIQILTTPENKHSIIFI